MIRFVKRNLKQPREAIDSARENLKEYSRFEIEKAEELLNTIEKLLEQQKEIHRRTRRNGLKQGIRINQGNLLFPILLILRLKRAI